MIVGSGSLATLIKKGLEIILLLIIPLSWQHAGICEIGETYIFEIGFQRPNNPTLVIQKITIDKRQYGTGA